MTGRMYHVTARTKAGPVFQHPVLRGVWVQPGTGYRRRYLSPPAVLETAFDTVLGVLDSRDLADDEPEPIEDDGGDCCEAGEDRGARA